MAETSLTRGSTIGIKENQSEEFLQRRCDCSSAVGLAAAPGVISRVPSIVSLFVAPKQLTQDQSLWVSLRPNRPLLIEGTSHPGQLPQSLCFSDVPICGIRHSSQPLSLATLGIMYKLSSLLQLLWKQQEPGRSGPEGSSYSLADYDPRGAIPGQLTLQ